MAFYFVGLGLKYEHITEEAKKVLKKTKVYIDNYTSFYPKEDLERLIEEFNPTFLDRDSCECNTDWIQDNVSFGVFGDPFFATTHSAIIEELNKKGIEYKYIPGISIFNVAFSLVGLMQYKIGGIVTIPEFECYSWLEKIKKNILDGKHTLVLVICDPYKAISYFKNMKIVLIQHATWKTERILYGYGKDIMKIENITHPVSIIVPGNLHPVEEESLKRFEI